MDVPVSGGVCLLIAIFMDRPEDLREPSGFVIFRAGVDVFFCAGAEGIDGPSLALLLDQSINSP